VHSRLFYSNALYRLLTYLEKIGWSDKNESETTSYDVVRLRMNVVECKHCRSNAKKMQPLLPGSDLVNTEQTIMASFDFLASENVDDDDDDDDDDDVMANGDSYNGRDTRASAEQLLANRFTVSYSLGLYIDRLQQSPFTSFQLYVFGQKLDRICWLQ